MRTASRELGELAHKGVFVLVGKGRQFRYELKSNRARIAPIAPNFEHGQKPLKNKSKSKVGRSLSPQTSKETTLETAQETSKETGVTSKEIWHLPDGLSDAARLITVTLLQNPTWTAKDVATHLGLTQQGVQYHIAKLAHVLHHEGPTKKGRWVFGPKPKDNRHEK